MPTVPPFGGFPATSLWEKTLSQAKNMLKGLCILSALRTPWDPPEGAGECHCGNRYLGQSAGTVQPAGHG